MLSNAASGLQLAANDACHAHNMSTSCLLALACMSTLHMRTPFSKHTSNEVLQTRCLAFAGHQPKESHGVHPTAVINHRRDLGGKISGSSHCNHTESHTRATKPVSGWDSHRCNPYSHWVALHFLACTKWACTELTGYSPIVLMCIIHIITTKFSELCGTCMHGDVLWMQDMLAP